MPRSDRQVDYRPLLAASIAAAKATTHHQRVLKARDRLHLILAEYFPHGEGHSSPLAHANNLAAGLADTPPGERWHGVLASLRAKGLEGKVLEKAAMRVCVAWAFSMGSGA